MPSNESPVMGSLCHGPAKESTGSSLIGCTSLLAESGILRTRSGRAGSGLGIQSAGYCPQQLDDYAVDPTPSLPSSLLATVWTGRCHPAGPYIGSGPGRGLSSATAPGCSRGRARCRAPRARAAQGRVGLIVCSESATSRAGWPVPLGPGLEDEPHGATRWRAESSERIATGSPAPVAVGRTVGASAGTELPRADRRGRRHCGGRVRRRAPCLGTNHTGPLAGALDHRSASPQGARRQSPWVALWGRLPGQSCRVRIAVGANSEGSASEVWVRSTGR